MSKLYNKYLECKEKDNSKYYLFKSGLFYVFIADDAIEISKVTTLKATKLTENLYKCGFPTNSLDKYLNIFEAIGKDVVIVDNDEIKVEKKSI